MKQFAMPALVLSLLAAPVAAQQDDDGLNLMEEGARLFLRGLMTEMEPALKELDEVTREMQPLLRDFAVEMGPALADLLEKVEDWTVYHPPEMLDNGDILIRRREPLTPETPDPESDPDLGPGPKAAPEEQIDL
ncbi:hypothetical protein ANTHELSMS3_04016 [Antarctobacter heliothermus]|uniref:AAA+ family ATPase n=1 Tax=Antarctobacter heliothermus TaxID=74033 RepID=A0A222E8U8_9RHOB|nr:hypothetical protein [Antarctobacter heliothermus]ASP22625.1 hypothetical protein ANTHELSMS3_04016 [Antarctobacter heliothermus]